MRIVFASDDLIGCVHDRVGDAFVDYTQFGVGQGSCALDLGQGPNVPRFQWGSTDREVLYRALGLGAVEGGRGYAYFAHRVVFNTEFRSIFGHIPMLPYRRAGAPRGSTERRGGFH